MFLGTGYKILSEKFHKEICDNPGEERMRVVQAAADTIRENI